MKSQPKQEKKKIKNSVLIHEGYFKHYEDMEYFSRSIHPPMILLRTEEIYFPYNGWKITWWQPESKIDK